MRRLRHALFLFFAAVGFIVLFSLVAGWATRGWWSERLLRSTLEGAGLSVESLSVEEISPDGMSLGPTHVVWSGHTLEVDRTTLAIASVLPPRLGQVSIEGVSLGLNLDNLLKEASKGDTTATPEAFEEWPRPPLEAFKAQMTLTVGGSAGVAPPLSLKMDLRGKDDSVAGQVALAGDGLAWDLTAKMVPERREVTAAWSDASLDISDLLSQYRAFLPSLPVDLSVGGVLSSTGDFEFKGDEWRAATTVKLRSGTLSWPAKNVSAEGIQLETLADYSGGRISLAPSSRLTFDKVSVGNLFVTAGRLGFSAESEELVHVLGFKCELMGGSVELAPFSFNPKLPEITSQLTLTGIDLNELSKLLPDIKAEVGGRISGQVRFRATEKTFQFIGGGLSLDKSTPATLRLRQKGLITNGVSPQSLVYTTLQKVEDGLLFLVMDSLQAEILPTQGPDERSMILRIAAHPQDPDVKAPVAIDLNVTGPLASLISWGINQNLSSGSKP